MHITCAASNKRLGYLILIVLFGTCILTSLWIAVDYLVVEPAKEREQSERNRQLCQPILDALQRYRQKEGAYPSNLDALVPNYIDQIPRMLNGEVPKYERTSSSYALAYSYAGRALYLCQYKPESRWECFGMR